MCQWTNNKTHTFIGLFYPPENFSCFNDYHFLTYQSSASVTKFHIVNPQFPINIFHQFLYIFPVPFFLGTLKEKWHPFLLINWWYAVSLLASFRTPFCIPSWSIPNALCQCNNYRFFNVILQYPHPIEKFKKEFDFYAMNKKFNKDEVWDILVKAKSPF